MKKITFKPKFRHVYEILKAWVLPNAEAVIYFRTKDVTDALEDFPRLTISQKHNKR